MQKTIHYLFSTLDDREKVILLERYLLRMSLRGIGKDFSVSRERIRQIMERSFLKMNSQFTKIVKEATMSWEVIRPLKSFFEYQLPIVTVVRRPYFSFLTFSFSKRVRMELEYEDEEWCELYRDKSRILFQFLDQRTENARKLSMIKGKHGSVRCTGNLNIKSLDPSLLPKELSRYLLEKEGPKNGYIDMEKPLSPEDIGELLAKES